ncbi:hypothetical protein ElyMa_000406300 [Elysia marginata]|uniref:Uncharacterized protein n=1 Tax=Elysia marginata TaxID=1093978 RepID=A0AAV4FJN1_9GAST|nr:hypothetical protein ElyMa_000406300 [Elysia marginata]
MDENIGLFTDMFTNIQMVVWAWSLFQHRRIEKATWILPNYNLGTENQINHICINHSFRSSPQDVEVFRGTDVGSDRHPVVAKIKLKLRRGNFAPHQRLRYNVNLLSNPKKREEYAMDVFNRFYTLETQGSVEDIEDYWNEIKGV